MKRATKCGITTLMLSAIIAWIGIPHCVACGITPPPVQIIRPAGSYDDTPVPASSWLDAGSPYRFDFQGVVDGTPGSYNLDIEGLVPAGYGYQWSLDSTAGTLTNETTGTPSHHAPDEPGEGTLTLTATQNGSNTDGTDSRALKIYEDHLTRDRDTFGVDHSCGSPYDPFWSPGKFNTSITEFGWWNCHGSVWHAYDGSKGPSVDRTEGLPPGEVIWVGYDVEDDFWKEDLMRGDIVAYYSVDYGGGTYNETLQHSQTVLSGFTTYGANNEPVVGTTESWKWAESEAGEWAKAVSESLRPFKVKVTSPGS